MGPGGQTGIGLGGEVWPFICCQFQICKVWPDLKSSSKAQSPLAGMSIPRQPGPCQGSWGARPRLQGAGLLVSGTWAQNQPVGWGGCLCHGQWRGKEQTRAQLDHPPSPSTSDLPFRPSLPLDILLEPRDLGLWTTPYKSPIAWPDQKSPKWRTSYSDTEPPTGPA